MNAWCGYLVNATRQEVDQWPLNKLHDRIRLSYCQTCSSRLNIAHYFNVGVHPSGPYYENNVWKYTERMQKANSMASGGGAHYWAPKLLLGKDVAHTASEVHPGLACSAGRGKCGFQSFMCLCKLDCPGEAASQSAGAPAWGA